MRVLLILNGPTANRGCEAILLSTYAIIKEAFPDATFVNSSFRDDRAKRVRYLSLPDLRHECHPAPDTFDWWKWQWAKRIGRNRFNFERFLAWADVVLSLGGDNYTLEYGSIDAYLTANAQVLESGKPLVLWGVSVGPFKNNPEVEERVAEQFRAAYSIVAREHRTVEYLSELGVRENVLMMPDPAFSLTPETVSPPHSIGQLLEDGAIGVNISPLIARYHGGYANWLSTVRQWLNALLRATDRPILLIPHVFEPGNDDYEFMEAVLRGLDTTHSKIALLNGRGLSSRQLKYIIAQLKIFIGTRTHAAIAALSMNVPTLSISYSTKAIGISEDILGDARWVAPHQLLTAERLCELAQNLMAERQSIKMQLASKSVSHRVKPALVYQLFNPCKSVHVDSKD